MPEIDNTEAIIRKMEPIVRELNYPELVVLNRMVVERIRMIQKARTLVSMSRFHVNDRVIWTGRDGSVRTGVIIRLNQRTATIKTAMDEYWKVSPQFLRKAD